MTSESSPFQQSAPNTREIVPQNSLDLTTGPRPIPQRPWTSQDFVWWNTAGVLTSIRQGQRPHPVSPVVDPVRRAFSPDEVMLGTCDAQMLMWRKGNAEYNPSRGFFLAGGPVGLALTAAFFGGQAAMNKKKKKAAEQDAVEKWRHLAYARLTVSTHGLYLATGEGIMSVSFNDIQECHVTGPGEIIIAAANAHGSARWMLRGQWAELVMVQWAAHFLPDHPQLTTRSWLPGDWFLHARAYGYDVDTRSWPRLPGGGQSSITM
ncbi:hypothetical protein [Actinomyces vulturis]|uniref:hypothetical protein n=1 Tax=Actinomyces vulturis TaxID=1857645 RepID=UPI000A574229|nr:hypothetical protein [Actinomyces vulturis]